MTSRQGEKLEQIQGSSYLQKPEAEAGARPLHPGAARALLSAGGRRGREPQRPGSRRVWDGQAVGKAEVARLPLGLGNPGRSGGGGPGTGKSRAVFKRKVGVCFEDPKRRTAPRAGAEGGPGFVPGGGATGPGRARRRPAGAPLAVPRPAGPQPATRSRRPARGR